MKLWKRAHHIKKGKIQSEEPKVTRVTHSSTQKDSQPTKNGEHSPPSDNHRAPDDPSLANPEEEQSLVAAHNYLSLSNPPTQDNDVDTDPVISTKPGQPSVTIYH